MSEISLAPFRAAFPNPSPQLQTCIDYLVAIGDQDLPKILSLLTEDHKYEWVARGFESFGPRVKDKKQTEAFFEASLGKMFVGYRVSERGRFCAYMEFD